MSKGVNPYEAPASLTNSLGPARGRLHALRWFPAVFCFLFGGVAVADLVSGLWTTLRMTRAGYTFADDMWAELLAQSALLLPEAVAGLVAARAWMKGRWWWAVIATVVLVGTFILFVHRGPGPVH